VVAVEADLAGVLERVQRRVSGKRVAWLVDYGCELRIMAERVVIAQLLVAEREAIVPLAQQTGDGCCA
jgi:hypothetical protein